MEVEASVETREELSRGGAVGAGVEGFSSFLEEENEVSKYNFNL